MSLGKTTRNRNNNNNNRRWWWTKFRWFDESAKTNIT